MEEDHTRLLRTEYIKQVSTIRRATYIVHKALDISYFFKNITQFRQRPFRKTVEFVQTRRIILTLRSLVRFNNQ